MATFCLCCVKINFVFLDREYNLCLPRREVEEVDNLRDEWIKLMELAEKVCCSKIKQRNLS